MKELNVIVKFINFFLELSEKQRKLQERRQTSAIGKKSHVSDESISTASLESIIEGLKFKNVRKSTLSNYYSVWKTFNEFFIKLDRKPKAWEERIVLFAGHLIDKKDSSKQFKATSQQLN